MQPQHHPDPCLSASIYCSGRLSEVLCHVVRPLWLEIKSLAAQEDGYLWTMRYARGGEHLKLRLHGGAAVEQIVRKRLPALTGTYLRTLPDVDEKAPRLSTPSATPIDLEDHETQDAPDRTFRWTTYARSHVSLGTAPYQDHDCYVGALTRTLARGTEVILERLKTQANGTAAFGKIQGILIQLVVATLWVAQFDEDQRAAYLRYHRDWLLRAALKYGRSGGGPKKLAATLDRFNRQVASMGDGAARVEGFARSRWADDSTSRDEQQAGHMARFEADIVTLLTLLRPIVPDHRFHIDPFANDPLWPPLFRVLHGLANQLGLNALNESFVYHLLLSVGTDGTTKAESVALAPAL